MPTENSNPPAAAIEVRNLSRSFGSVQAIDGVSFKVETGQVVGFLGPNGAGKSTTLRILAGLLPATSGQAWIAGIPVASQPDAVKKRIGYMPETNPLPEEMRVDEYLRFRARLKGLPRWVQRERVEAVMELCNLQHKARRKIIGTLSKGFRQRVGIADAIIAQPEVVIMDEPTIGLDPHQVIGIRELIDTLRGRMTVILSSHILSEIELSCDSVIIINHGRLVAQGTPGLLRKEFLPAQRYCIHAKIGADALLGALKASFATVHIVRSEVTTEGFERHEVEIEHNGSLGETIIHKLVREENIAVREVFFRRARLEDVFLAATRQSWRETTPLTSAHELQVS